MLLFQNLSNLKQLGSDFLKEICLFLGDKQAKHAKYSSWKKNVISFSWKKITLLQQEAVVVFKSISFTPYSKTFITENVLLVAAVSSLHKHVDSMEK